MYRSWRQDENALTARLGRTLADAYRQHSYLIFKNPRGTVGVGDRFVVKAAGRTYRASANAYGNWYGYIGTQKVTLFWGDYIDQQFDAWDWTILMGQAAALRTA